MLEIRKISWRDILDAPNAEALLTEYTAECSLPELGATNPQRYLYEAMENSGGLQAFGVYEGQVLTGFAAVLVYVLPHYGQKIATTESIFLAAAYRHKGAGAELLRTIEAYAREQGCRAVLYTAPVGSRFSKLLAVNVGRYRRTNHVYLRKLG